MLARSRITFSKYSAITLTNLQNQLAYVWDIFNRSLFIVIIMFVFVQLWTAVYNGRGGGEISGLTLANTIWYLLFAEMMELGKFRHDARISEEVKDGSIAYTLVRPYNYLAYHFFNGLGESAVRMVLVLALGMPIVLYYAGLPNLNWVTLPLAFIVMFGAIIIDFCALSIIGLLAFITEDITSFRLIYQKLVFILGGLMLPLDFLPDWLRRIAELLPFNLTTYAPAKLIVAFSWEQFGRFLIMQAVWICILGAVLIWQYRWATKRLAVNGG